MVMRYCNTAAPTASATANTLGTQAAYILNSTYAPGGASGAHQPYGRDIIGSLYSKYRVISTRVTICAELYGIPATPGAFYFAAIVVAPQDPLAISGYSVQQIAEKPNAYLMRHHSDGPNSMSFDVDMAKVSGVTKTEFDGDDRFAAISTASPSATVQLLVATANNLSSALSTPALITFDMLVEWTEPIVQGIS